MTREDIHPRELEIAGGGVVVARTASDGEAEMVRQILASHDIPSRIVSDVARPWPVSVAESRVVVPPEMRARAAAVIAEHRREGLRVVRGGEAAGGKRTGRSQRTERTRNPRARPW